MGNPGVCGRGFDFMYDYEVCIIGGGVLGCMAARELMRYRVRAVLAERREDVCTGITRANTAVVYAGYDNRPGTLKARFCVQGNAGYDKLCRELGVSMKRSGSLMVCFGPRGEQRLEKKLAWGRENGVPGLRIVEREELLEMEPNLSRKVFRGLYAPTTATVNPWELGIAAFENARENGCTMKLSTEVTQLRRWREGFEVTFLDCKSGRQEVQRVRCVLNCAGLWADKVRELAFSPKIRIFPKRADYLVFDRKIQGLFNHILFYEPEEKGKGLTLVPTVEGTLLAGPSEQPCGDREQFCTTREGIDFVLGMCQKVMPELSEKAIIRDFASIRPNPFAVEPTEDGTYRQVEKSYPGFVVEQEEECPGMISFLGIKTPGLTCSAKLAEYAVGKLLEVMEASGFKAEQNPDFQPIRHAPAQVRTLSFEEWKRLADREPEFRNMVCSCEKVTEGEVLEAIRRGAVTVDGVKRRCGTGMGRCQGSRCELKVLELLARELGALPEQICKDGQGSWMVKKFQE